MNRSKLHKILTTYFSDNELHMLCFDLSIDYEDLGGESKSAKARELILYCERHVRLDELIAVARAVRPNAPWDDDDASTSTAPAPSTATPQTAPAALPVQASFAQMTGAQKRQLRDKLLACPSISDPASRATVINQLPPNLRSQIRYDGRPDIHVQNIVNACISYKGGLEALLDEVRGFDEGTIALEALDQFVQTLRP